MLDETSTVDYTAIAFATRHDGSGFFIVSAHRCYSLGSVSLRRHPLDLGRTYKRVSVMGEIQVNSIDCLLDPQDANGSGGMTLLYAGVP